MQALSLVLQQRALVTEVRTLLAASSILVAAVGLGTVVYTRHAAPITGLPLNDFTAANIKHFELKEQEAAGLCPWRNREADLKRCYPLADTVLETTLVVSSQRIALTRRLGRTPTGDENGLRVYAIRRRSTPCGTIVARRVRGEYGLIELVFAVDAGSSSIREAWIQREREPDPGGAALQSPTWLKQFCGLSGESDWKRVAHASCLPAGAGVSAEAVTEAARTALILLDTAQRMNVSVPAQVVTGSH